MDVSRIADRYIGRDGGAPRPDEEQSKPRAIDAGDVVKVANFIGYHDYSDIWGGVRAEDAWASLCRLLNVEPKRLRQIIRPD